MDNEFWFGLVLLIIGFGVVLVFSFPFVLSAYRRLLQHKEIIMMIEKGIIKPERMYNNNKSFLNWGIILACLGFALMLGLFPIGFLFNPNYFPLYFGPWMMVGLIPAFLGIALVLIYYFSRKENSDSIDKNEETELSIDELLNSESESDVD